MESYPYGFNGKENDPEVVGTGEGTQDYGFRIYNPSLGKFLSVDPLFKGFPFYTPYQFAGNMPIWAIDLDGSEQKLKTKVFNVYIINTTTEGKEGTVTTYEKRQMTKGDNGGPTLYKIHEETRRIDKQGRILSSPAELIGTASELSPELASQFPSNSNSNSLSQQKQTPQIEKTSSGGLIKRTETSSTAANQNTNPLIVVLYTQISNEPTKEDFEAETKYNEKAKANYTKNNPGRNIIFVETLEQNKNLPGNTKLKSGSYTLEGDKTYSNEDIKKSTEKHAETGKAQ